MTINREHLAGLELALSLMINQRLSSGGVHLNALASLEAAVEQAQAAPEVEPVEVVCITQGGCNVTWTATKELTPAGTELMSVRQHQRIMASAPQHDAELVELERANAECFRQIATDLVMKVLILTAPGDELRRASADALERIDAKLATLSAKP